MEETMLNVVLLILSLLALGIQLAGIGSAAVMFLSAFPLFIVLLANRVLGRLTNGSGSRVSLWVYALGQTLPALGGTMLTVPVIEFFVPLVCPYPLSLVILDADCNHVSRQAESAQPPQTTFSLQ
jgi:hypothetical protein